LRQQVIDQQRNIAAPFAQRRHSHAERVEPVIQISAKALLCDFPFERADASSR
jgi:hypothetical protein